MKPIYEPKGRAKEYGDLALNIYTGCTHGCSYCYAPKVLKKTAKDFSSNVTARKGILEATKKQLASGAYTGKLIHLCFTCDPYPIGIDTSITREIIKEIKDVGANVQILTKGGFQAQRDFDLLDENDWIGTTITGAARSIVPPPAEPYCARVDERLGLLQRAKKAGLNTWVSCEPVLNEYVIYDLINHATYIDFYKIGKLNYQLSGIDWAEFGRECERLCIERGRNYYIKDDLRKEMKS